MQTLVLNAAGAPHRIISWEEAMAELLNEGETRGKKRKRKPIVIEYYDDKVIHSAYEEWKVPSIIQFLDVKFRPQRSLRYSRNNLYVRDHGRCQYCGTNVPRPEFTIDHVTPKSQGGKTTWENTVACCIPCNSKKGSKTLAQAGMRLMRAPFKPDSLPSDPEFGLKWRPGMPEAWKDYMLSVGYWQGELENENK